MSKRGAQCFYQGNFIPLIHPELVEGRIKHRIFAKYFGFFMTDFYVYILKCSDESYYIGHTNNLEQRIAEHNNGGYSVYTATRRPFSVVFIQTFPTRDEALTMERRIKGWSRQKKEALIKGDWQEIVRLSNLKKDTQ